MPTTKIDTSESGGEFTLKHEHQFGVLTVRGNDLGSAIALSVDDLNNSGAGSRQLVRLSPEHWMRFAQWVLGRTGHTPIESIADARRAALKEA